MLPVVILLPSITVTLLMSVLAKSPAAAYPVITADFITTVPFAVT